MRWHEAASAWIQVYYFQLDAHNNKNEWPINCAQSDETSSRNFSTFESMKAKKLWLWKWIELEMIDLNFFSSSRTCIEGAQIFMSTLQPFSCYKKCFKDFFAAHVTDSIKANSCFFFFYSFAYVICASEHSVI